LLFSFPNAIRDDLGIFGRKLDVTDRFIDDVADVFGWSDMLFLSSLLDTPPISMCELHRYLVAM